ncbi:MAG TPA: amidohydrolase family protein [Caulobacteraceae bacterium]|jgi:predicted TIM-barrel fold metal-dependent hydrolase|nr:amidohydrolase family protein [Caulobacteraceae bacterium]
MSDPAQPREAILEPELPIVDPHHHLWDRRAAMAAVEGPPRHGFEALLRLSPRYFLDELLADMQSGHNVIATVFVECGAFYRAEGPPRMRPVGETEFVNGVAAMGASGLYGNVRPCAGIVGHADLTLGESVEDVLEAHVAAGGGRFRGIRQSASADADPAVLGPLGRRAPGLYNDNQFRRGFARLKHLNLSFDAWLLEPQLPELVSLGRAFQGTTIILDHVGTPLGIGGYAGRRDERFGAWREQIRLLAELPHVFVKLGGLAMPFAGFSSFMSDPPASSEQLAAEWKPYIETCIEAFGAHRCMFESNFPVDLGSCTYEVLWNAFKRLAADASDGEKADLFHGTAARAYRLDLPAAA